MTFAEMQTEVFARLEENSTTPAFWALADVKNALNEGLEEISDASEWLEKNYAVPHVANQLYYNLSTALGSDTILTPKHALNNQTNRWIEFREVRDLDRQLLEWETVTGEEEQCVLRGLWWFGIFPHSSDAAGSFTVYYSALPPARVNDADSPNFPEEYHYGLVEYALGDLLSQERDYRKALAHFTEYSQYERGLTEYVQGRISKDRIFSLHG